MTAPLTTVQARFADALEHAGPVMIRLGDIQRLFTDARPRTSEHSDRRRELREDLDAVAAVGRLHLPRLDKSWDRSALPPLPKFVTVRPAVRRPPAVSRVKSDGVGWRPELRWAAGQATWGPRRLADLIEINRFVSTAHARPVVPLRERSVQLFGDEKRLGQLITDERIFGPGKLSLDLLRTVRTSPPFIRVVKNPLRRDVLIVENWDTFDTLSKFGPEVGDVLYGAGAHVTAALPSLLDAPPEAMTYFGDLDVAGVAIARRAADAAAELELPPLRPAVNLYRCLLEHGTPQATGSKNPTGADLAAAEWLEDEDLIEAVRVLIGSGHRLAQEQVGVELLTQSPLAAP